MTNTKILCELRPAYAEMSSLANLIHRGEILGFRPNQKGKFHSTDAGGFRHTMFKGKPLPVIETVALDRYAIVLGSSHIFGLGLPSNDFTLPSLLGARFDFPFANASLPEANTRNQFALLAALLARAKRPPEIVILFNGGDFTSFAVSSLADPVFGSPNLKQMDALKEELGGFPDSAASVDALHEFTDLWTRSIIDLCRSAEIPLVLGRDSTFFEKRTPTEFEKACEIGIPNNERQARWFETHRNFNPEAFARREQLAESLDIPLLGPKPPTELTFLDEWHYDRNGMRMMFEAVAKGIEPILAVKAA